MACAFHYRHTGMIVPASAAIAVKYLRNVDLIRGALEDKVFSLLSKSEHLQRANVDLGPQFQYRYGVSDDAMIGAYLSFFRRSFALLVLVLNDPAVIADYTNELRFLGPLKGARSPSQ